MRQLILVAISILPGYELIAGSTITAAVSTENINLALRRTADGLLRASGDSTSRIPSVEQIKEGVWQVRLERDFRYEQLPFILQTSLDLYGIQQAYQVSIRNCEDSKIELGYHQYDFLNTNQVPCQGRELPKACRYIEISFLEATQLQQTHSSKLTWILFALVGLVSFWIYKKNKNDHKVITSIEEVECLEFGNLKLDAENQILYCADDRQTLTFRETKLLKLLINHQNQILERDQLLREVWADEGILVGRSLDVFVSRLRKKIAVDTSVAIAAIHGVGYRLEIKK
ncbi:MAG: response regulator transcription factor [Saprospiraceae bacterium]|nr:response regulator transcription factor [Saprospiraceae bacterium]